MKPMTPKRTRRLRARAATMQTHEEEYEDYGPEPNMKLSHAFMVVLLLHVVAVGGLYAFNSMKNSKAPKLAAAKAPALAGEQAEPVAREVGGSQKQNPLEPQNQQPGNGGQEPSEEKAPLVAKASDTLKSRNAAKAPKESKASEGGALQQPSETSQPAHKGLLASMRGALEKAAGITTMAGGTGHALAQDASNAPVGGAAVPANDGSQPAKTYIVKAGDTITRIASSLGVTIPDLEKANGLVQSSVLQVGQALKVPAQAVAQAAADVSTQAGKVVAGAQQLPTAVASAAGNVVNPAETAPGTSQGAAIVTEYTVVKGDSPYKISKRFKITPDELMKANGITDPKKIQIGQKLKIPASTKKSAKSAQ